MGIKGNYEEGRRVDTEQRLMSAAAGEALLGRILELEARLATADARIAALEARPSLTFGTNSYPTPTNGYTGYRCASCGMFVMDGTVHSCMGKVNT